jgi:hypothetical protein
MENTRDWLSRLLEMIPVKGTLDYRCFLGAPWPSIIVFAQYREEMGHDKEPCWCASGAEARAGRGRHASCATLGPTQPGTPSGTSGLAPRAGLMAGS